MYRQSGCKRVEAHHARSKFQEHVAPFQAFAAAEMIIGTAGHIGHGKTALVRALTGVDADRLPEEKRRGMDDRSRLRLSRAAGHKRRSQSARARDARLYRCTGARALYPQHARR